jgi:hypothetical protein
MHCLLMTGLLLVMKRLILPLTKAVDLAFPLGYIKKHKYTPWLYRKLKFYIEKWVVLIEFSRSTETDCFMTKSVFLL